MTSPYKEDSPPPNPSGYCSTDIRWGGPSPCRPSNIITNYYLDRNTFGSGGKISENDSQFAGLCLNCPTKSSLTDGLNNNKDWKSSDRIHESVKGWGANTEHNYTCSKCHQPHNSGLPRLMQTNCLDFQHRGSKVSGGTVYMADNWGAKPHGTAGEHRGFPIGNLFNNSVSYEAATSCHNVSGSWPSKNYWNVLTPF
jgi:hypothetical protein